MNNEDDFQSAIRTPPASAGATDTDIRAEQNQTPAGETSFIDEKELLARLPVVGAL